MLREAQAPHVEDARWDMNRVKKVDLKKVDELTRALESSAIEGVGRAFGEPNIQSGHGNHGWQPGAGARSLATVRVKSISASRMETGIRMQLTDGQDRTWHGVPMQDLALRIHAETCAECQLPERLLSNAREEFDRQNVLVRVGLTRPYASADEPEACWLQVTNVLARPRVHFV